MNEPKLIRCNSKSQAVIFCKEQFMLKDCMQNVVALIDEINKAHTPDSIAGRCDFLYSFNPRIMIKHMSVPIEVNSFIKLHLSFEDDSVFECELDLESEQITVVGLFAIEK
jgi:hypothetical protein